MLLNDAVNKAMVSPTLISTRRTSDGNINAGEYGALIARS
jgi:hypothetical protein